MTRDRLALLDSEADDEVVDGFLAALGVMPGARAEDDEDDHYYGAWIGGKKSQGGHPAHGGGGSKAEPKKSSSSKSQTTSDQHTGVSPAELEKKIQQLRGGETAFFVGPDGKILFDKTDMGSEKNAHGQNKYGVDFTHDELAKVRGATLVHNHPSGWDFPASDPRRAGNSFSPDDVGLAIQHNLAGVVAITPTRRFSLKPGPKGWGMTSVEYRAAVDTANRLTRERFTKWVYTGHEGWGDTVDERAAHAETEHWDEVWTHMARTFHWEYTEEPA